MFKGLLNPKYITVKTKNPVYITDFRAKNGYRTIKRPWYQTKNANVKVGSKVLVPVGNGRMLAKVMHIQKDKPQELIDKGMEARPIKSLIEK